MKLSIPKAQLQKGLARVQAVIEKRNSMPILANVLLTARSESDGRLEVCATDLEVGVHGSHPAKVAQPGALTTGARKLYEIVRELPDREVQLSQTADSFLELTCDRGRFTLAATAAEEFPQLSDLHPSTTARVQAPVLSVMIERTLYAASVDETRYNLNGVYLEVLPEVGKLRMVATDGHRLAYVDRGIGGDAEALRSGIILPRKALAEVRKVVDEEDADEVEVGFEENSAVIHKGQVSLVMRLIEGEFPSYQEVIPKAIDHRITVPAESLEAVLRRVALVSGERTRSVQVELKAGELTISSNNPELGTARESMDADYDGSGLSIGFNARYLLDSLTAFHSKEVTLSFGDALAPATLQPTDDPDTMAVVMPMRL